MEFKTVYSTSDKSSCVFVLEKEHDGTYLLGIQDDEFCRVNFSADQLRMLTRALLDELDWRVTPKERAVIIAQLDGIETPLYK